MKNRIIYISLAVMLALSVGLAGCGGQDVPEVTEYKLTISSTDGGSVTTPGEGTGSFTYDEGEVVDLMAEAEKGYYFVNWTGDVDTIDDLDAASTTVTMNANYEITAKFEETPPITFAIAGPMTEMPGKHQWAAAEMARDEINAGASVNVGGVYHNIKLVQVETQELTEGEDGSTGTASLEAIIDDVDFVLGGALEAHVQVYGDVAINAKKIFMNCGAATQSLQYSVVKDYATYKYWFMTSPINREFIGTSLFKLTEGIGMALKNALVAEGDAVSGDYKVTEDNKLRVAILMENAAWCTMGLVPGSQVCLPEYGFEVVGTWLVSPTATDISTELTQIEVKKPHIIFDGFSGPVCAVYSKQKAELGIPAMTIGLTPGWEKSHWENTDGKCHGEIVLDTWAEGLQNTAKTTAFFNAFVGKTGEYPSSPAATYDAIYQLKEAIEVVSAAQGWDDIADVVAPANIDALIQYLETSSHVGTRGKTAYYPMPDIDLGSGVYALSEEQVRALYDLDSYGEMYVQSQWRVSSTYVSDGICIRASGHIAHDMVYGPGYQTGIGSQWQDGHKVGVWPIDLGDDYDAALTDRYGCWNFEYPGTVDVVIPIQGFLA
ncbi:MAG: ABC transporter substrate-binding protein [Dehalococcoidia bacterium]